MYVARSRTLSNLPSLSHKTPRGSTNPLTKTFHETTNNQNEDSRKNFEKKVSLPNEQTTPLDFKSLQNPQNLSETQPQDSEDLLHSKLLLNLKTPTTPSIALKDLENLAEKNIPEALYLLSIRYAKGIEVEKDYDKGINLCTKAADAGLAEAQVQLSLYYKKSDDMDMAFKWCEKAAKQGSGKALNLLSDYYYSDGDFENAFKYAKEAAQKGFMEAQFNVATNYYNGNGVERNFEEAAKWFEAAAKQGSALAQQYLGYCYSNGVGVTADMQKATEWMKKAAKQKVAEAELWLGNKYFERQDYSEAEKYFQRPAEDGYSIAQYFLALCSMKKNIDIFTIEEATLTLEKAIYWLNKAAESGDPRPLHNLALCHFYMSNETLTLTYYQLAANKESSDGKYGVGMCYELGIGCEINPLHALYWYIQAVQGGNKEAMHSALRIIKSGKISEDSEKFQKSWKEVAKSKEIESPQDFLDWYEKVVKLDDKEIALSLLSFLDEIEEGDFRRGACCETGLGRQENPLYALYWYTKAIENGHKNAILSAIRLLKSEKIQNSEKFQTWHSEVSLSEEIEDPENFLNWYKEVLNNKSQGFSRLILNLIPDDDEIKKPEKFFNWIQQNKNIPRKFSILQSLVSVRRKMESSGDESLIFGNNLYE